MTNDDQTSAGFAPADEWAPDRLMTPAQVADLLAISTGSLANERSTGTSRIPYCKVGGRVRYRATDVHAYINSRMVSA